MNKPLLVSIAGCPKMGVTTACERVSRSLNTQNINTVIVKLRSSKEVWQFENNWLLGKYNGVAVVIVDNHYNVQSAVKRRLHNPLYENDSIKPDISFLMTCTAKTYQQRNGGLLGNINILLDNYSTLSKVFFGTRNHHLLKCDGSYGQLVCAGQMKKIISAELPPHPKG